MKKLAIKDIPELEIFEAIIKHENGQDGWRSKKLPDGSWTPTGAAFYLQQYPEKLVWAKMESMLRKGLLKDCGPSIRCWKISENGFALCLNKPNLSPA